MSSEDSPNEMREGLLRLKDELLRRKIATKTHDEEALPTFQPVGMKPLFQTGFFMLLIATTLLYFTREKNIEKIAKANPHELRLEDFQGAFGVYKSEKYFEMRAEYEKKCEQNKDVNCRLYSYFKSMEKDEVAALNLAKISCSADDPQSCYLIYINEHATEADRKPASSQLDESCKDEKFKAQTCCQCYKQAKKD